jgi:hypothetical protein
MRRSSRRYDGNQSSLPGTPIGSEAPAGLPRFAPDRAGVLLSAGAAVQTGSRLWQKIHNGDLPNGPRGGAQAQPTEFLADARAQDFPWRQEFGRFRSPDFRVGDSVDQIR